MVVTQNLPLKILKFYNFYPLLSKLLCLQILFILTLGDNLLTAITVSRDCGMIEEHDSVISVEANLVPSDSVTCTAKNRLQVFYNYAKLPGFSEKLNMVQNGMIDVSINNSLL